MILKNQSDPALIALLPVLLDYNQESGALIWKRRGREFFKTDRDCAAWNTRFCGKTAGRLRAGYLDVRVLGVEIGAHRIAWAIHFGKWPDNCIDHIDGVRCNNAISNLRDVTIMVNNQNITRKKKCEKSLPIGVFLDLRSQKNPYVSSLKVSGKTVHLGRFDTPERAYAAYVSAKRRFHPGCTL